MREEERLLELVIKLIENLDHAVDSHVPKKIADIIKDHSIGAAVSATGSALIPGVGGTAAVAISGGFVLSMYIRINKELGISISQNIIQSVASAITTNLAGTALSSVILSGISSFIPGLGSIASSFIMGATCYSLTLVSGIIYIKILTNIFETGQDPTNLSTDELKQMTKDTIQSEDIKDLINKAKKEFKKEKINANK